MRLSTLLMLLGILLWATTWRKWSDIWDRRRLTQIYQDIKTGRQRMTLYEKLVAPVSIALMFAGIYLSITGR
jgi:hypothetical protein